MLKDIMIKDYNSEHDGIEEIIKTEAELDKLAQLTISLSNSSLRDEEKGIKENVSLEGIIAFDLKSDFASLESFTGDIKDFVKSIKNKVTNRIVKLLSKLKENLKLEKIRSKRVEEFMKSKELDGIDEVQVVGKLDDLFQSELRSLVQYDILGKALTNGFIIANSLPLTMLNYFTKYNIDSKTDIEAALRNLLNKAKVEKDEVFTIVNNLIYKKAFSGLPDDELSLLKSEDAIFVPSAFYSNVVTGLFIGFKDKKAIMKNYRLILVEGKNIDTPTSIKLSFIKEVSESYSKHVKHYSDALNVYETTMNKIDDSFKAMAKYKKDNNKEGIDFINMVTKEIGKYSSDVLANASRSISLQRKFIYASLNNIEKKEETESEKGSRTFNAHTLGFD